MLLRLSSRFLPILLVAALLFSFSATQAQTTQQESTAPKATSGETKSNPDPERDHAMELYSQGKMAQAMPLFEELCAKYPQDGALWEKWGDTTAAYSQTLTDPELRKKARARARTYLIKAKELGDNSNLVQILLEMIPEDGGEITFSPRKEVDDLMQHAEADFARGDLDKARDGYLHALLLDPKNYDAALFIGDVYFKQNVYGSAG